MLRFRLALVLLVGTAGCLSAPPASQPPGYARTAPFYRDFETPRELAAYLRYNSEAGPLVSAHRGGPVPGYPENALATFDLMLRYAPVLIETDVRLSSDSVLVILHDDTLDRTTTGKGPLGAQTLAELRRLLLKDERGVVTPFRLPTLAEVLAWAEGRAVLTLDVKPEVPPQRLVDAVRRAHAEDEVVVIVYSLEDLMRYQRIAPELNYSVTVETVADVDALAASGLDVGRLIAFTGVGEVRPEVISRLHALGIRAILGTFGPIDARAARGGPEVYQAIIDQGVDVIATDDVRTAARAAAAYGPTDADP